MFSLNRDSSWLLHPDPAHRLYHGRKLLRDAVHAVYAKQCIVDWSLPHAPYHGVMMRKKPPWILVNPTAVIAHNGERMELLIMALHGVALHEASHAIHTSSRWGSVLRQIQLRHEIRTSVTLPEALLYVCANLAEDIWIEDCLAAEFPGFRTYFLGMRQYYYTDDECRECMEALKRLWSTYQADPCHFTEDAALTTACVNTVLNLMNRPDCTPLTPLKGTEPLWLSAETLRQAGKQNRLSVRLGGAVEATAQLFAFLRDWMTDTQEDPAEAVQRAVQACDLPLREDGNPRGKRRVKSGMTRRLMRALSEMEAMERQERVKEEAFAAENLVVPRLLEHSKGRALCTGKTVRIVDSSPETLYSYRSSMETKAAELMEQQRTQAEAFRRDFEQFIRQEQEQRNYGLRRGCVNEDALADLAAGRGDVFMQSHTQSEHRLDLTLLLDESGSMNSRVASTEPMNWEQASTTAILLEYALRAHCDGQQVRLRVYGFTSDAFVRGETILYRHFDSAIPRLNRPEALGWCYGKAYNCDGLALAAVRREILLRQKPGQVSALLMISDGQPHAQNYDGEAAEDHVRQEVEETVRAGIRFAHLQIGTTKEHVLNTMYGSRWQRVERSAELSVRVAELARLWLVSKK